MSPTEAVSAAASEDRDSRIPGAFPGAFPDSDDPSISPQRTLSQAVYARRAEYTRSRNIRIKVGTWNLAAMKDAEKDIAAWFFGGQNIDPKAGGFGIKTRSSTDSSTSSAQKTCTTAESAGRNTVPVPSEEAVDIYALGLQEIVDINSPAEALRPYTDPGPSNRIKEAIEKGLPAGYRLVAEQQLFGLLLLVYVSSSIASDIQSVSTTSVGTGIMGLMGNKGAVSSRLLLGETTRLVFINCHLGAGGDKTSLERRNWDAAQVASRTKFDPIPDPFSGEQRNGEGIGEEDFAFWFGDLNYRLEGMPGDDVRHLLTIHTKALDLEFPEPRDSLSLISDETKEDYGDKRESDEEEFSLPPSPASDPASLITTIKSLLPHDELQQQQKAEKAFHEGWKEGPITFLPTYKYDVGKVGVFDSSEKRRCPSWCDRILYRTRTAKLAYDKKIQEREEAKRKDEELKARGIEGNSDDDVLFDYDPETDGADEGYDDYDELDDPGPEPVVTKEGFEDEILLESYAAHQRVLSSDHKPLVGVFSLKYDAIIPDLKARIHQEVVRELDRTENEGRPSITLVVDRSAGTETRDGSDFDGVDFGEVRYSTSIRRTITVANTGRVPATFNFADRPAAPGQPEGAFPSWLTVQFDRDPDKTVSGSSNKQYTIQPADVMTIEFVLKINDIDLVRDLNNGISNLDEILVVRVQDGRDHFLSIVGTWLPSAFGRSIDQLIRVPEGGVRGLQNQKLTSDHEVKWSAPRELFRLTEALEDLTERTLAEWEMTGHEVDKAPWQHNAGWPFTVISLPEMSSAGDESAYSDVCEAIDCDKSFDTAFPPGTTSFAKLETLSEVLLQFLRSLEDGIVTQEMSEQLEKGMAAQERSKQPKSTEEEKLWILEILSSAPNHNVSFILLTSMLSRITNEIVSASKKDEVVSARSSTDLPASPQVSVRRKTLSKIPDVARRQLIVRNYAATFAPVMFRGPGAGGKEKEKKQREERMARVLEIFLDESGQGSG